MALIIELNKNKEQKIDNNDKKLLRNYADLYFASKMFNPDRMSRDNFVRMAIDNELSMLEKESQQLLGEYLGDIYSKTKSNYKEYISKGIKSIKNDILGTKQYEKMLKNLEKIERMEEWKAKRLIVTESSRAYNEGLQEELLEKGYTKAVVVLNNNTPCDICIEHLGVIEDLENAELPPYHANCRCYITGIEDI